MFGRRKTTAPARVPVPGMGGLVSADPVDLVASYAATNQKLYAENQDLLAKVGVLERKVAALDAQRQLVLAALGADAEIENLRRQLSDARRRADWADSHGYGDDLDDEDGDDE